MTLPSIPCQAMSASVPHRVRLPVDLPVEWREMILILRRTKMTGPQIARDLKRPRATVARMHDEMRDLFFAAARELDAELL